MRDTDWVYGIVMYVGNETKIFKNSKPTARKVSALMLLMNKMLYSVFAFQLCIIIIYATISSKWTKANLQS